MGRMIDGRWISDEEFSANKGAWERTPSVCRDWVRADGSTPYSPAAGRYHLWLSWSCTWSQRTLIALNLLGLDEAITHTMAHWHRNEDGWWFREGLDALQPLRRQPWEQWDRERGFTRAEPAMGISLHEIYRAGSPSYTGRATVPLLWDRHRGELVSNESADILRMMETEFAALQSRKVELFPASLAEEIEEVSAWVYEHINNGVYRAGFARDQSGYETAVADVFAALDRADERLAKSRYLCGENLTEADIRLFPTLIRFDAVYFGHFKCNVRRIADYPNLGPYLRDLYQTPGFANTCNVEFYKRGYMGRSERLNPSRIIPVGPALELDSLHDRERLGPRSIGVERSS